MWHHIYINEMWYNMKSTIILILRVFGISFFFPPYWLGEFSKHCGVDLGQAYEAVCGRKRLGFLNQSIWVQVYSPAI